MRYWKNYTRNPAQDAGHGDEGFQEKDETKRENEMNSVVEVE